MKLHDDYLCVGYRAVVEHYGQKQPGKETVYFTLQVVGQSAWKVMEEAQVRNMDV